jgi:hypothetical protein
MSRSKENPMNKQGADYSDDTTRRVEMIRALIWIASEQLDKLFREVGVEDTDAGAALRQVNDDLASVAGMSEREAETDPLCHPWITMHIDVRDDLGRYIEYYDIKH